MDKLTQFLKEQWEYGALAGSVLLALLVLWTGMASRQDMPKDVAASKTKLSRPKMLTPHACDFLDDTQREQRDMQRCPFDVPAQLGGVKSHSPSIKPAPRPPQGKPANQNKPAQKPAQQKTQKPAQNPAQTPAAKPVAPPAPATVPLKLNYYMSTVKDNRSRVAFVELATKGEKPKMQQWSIGQQIRGVTVLDIQENTLRIKDARGKVMNIGRKSQLQVHFLK